MVKDTQNKFYYFIISLSKKRNTRELLRKIGPLQKETTAWLVGI